MKKRTCCHYCRTCRLQFENTKRYEIHLSSRWDIVENNLSSDNTRETFLVRDENLDEETILCADEDEYFVNISPAMKAKVKVTQHRTGSGMKIDKKCFRPKMNARKRFPTILTSGKTVMNLEKKMIVTTIAQPISIHPRQRFSFSSIVMYTTFVDPRYEYCIVFGH